MFDTIAYLTKISGNPWVEVNVQRQTRNYGGESEKKEEEENALEKGRGGKIEKEGEEALKNTGSCTKLLILLVPFAQIKNLFTMDYSSTSKSVFSRLTLTESHDLTREYSASFPHQFCARSNQHIGVGKRPNSRRLNFWVPFGSGYVHPTWSKK